MAAELTAKAPPKANGWEHKELLALLLWSRMHDKQEHMNNFLKIGSFFEDKIFVCWNDTKMQSADFSVVYP